MIKYQADMTVPADDSGGMGGVKTEDGGQAMIAYCCEDVKEIAGDGHFFVDMHSWQDDAKKGDLSAHPLFRSLMGKRIRITIETLD